MAAWIVPGEPCGDRQFFRSQISKGPKTILFLSPTVTGKKKETREGTSHKKPGFAPWPIASTTNFVIAQRTRTAKSVKRLRWTHPKPERRGVHLASPAQSMEITSPLTSGRLAKVSNLKWVVLWVPSRALSQGCRIVLGTQKPNLENYPNPKHQREAP